MQTLGQAYAMENILKVKCARLREMSLRAGYIYVDSWELKPSGTLRDRKFALDSITVPSNHKESSMYRDLEYVLLALQNQIKQTERAKKDAKRNQLESERGFTVEFDLSLWHLVFIRYPELEGSNDSYSIFRQCFG